VGQATCEEISTETGWPPKSMHVALSRLVADGTISKKGNQRSATYTRAIQQVQQLNTLLNSPNASVARTRGGSSTKKIYSSIEKQNSCKEVLLNSKEVLRHNFVEQGGKQAVEPCIEGDLGCSTQFNNKAPVEHDPDELDDFGQNPDEFYSSETSKKTDEQAQNPDETDEHTQLLENYSPTLPNGKKTDCRVLLGNKWIWAKYIKERSKMRLSSINKTLEPAHSVDIVNGPTSVKRIEVAESEIQWLEGEDNE
jgi:predicted transcriptional regulator